MNKSNILAACASIKQKQRVILLNTKGQFMMESIILVSNVESNYRQSQALLHTKRYYMKESNVLTYSEKKLMKEAAESLSSLDKEGREESPTHHPFLKDNFTSW